MEKKFNFKILDIPDSTHYWFVRANTAAEYYDDFQLNNFVAIDSNNLPLIDLLTIPSTLRSSSDALKARYKTIFNNFDIAQYENNPDNNKKGIEERAQELAQIRTSSTNRAGKALSFVEKMNIGDFVFVPYKSATKFLVGIIVSDVTNDPITHVNLVNEKGELTYKISPYQYKRRVMWIKEITRRQFPEKLSWIRTAHQGLFDITKHGANVLNPVISPLYRYKGNVYCRIGVNTPEKISNSTWLEYQNTLQNIVGEKNNENIFQKSRVQSLGDITQFASNNWWWLILLLEQGLFGEVNYDVFGLSGTFEGPLKRFLPKEKKKESEKEKNEQIDNDLKEAQTEAAKAEAHKNEAEAAVQDALKKKIEAETNKILSAIPDKDKRNNKLVRKSITNRVSNNIDRINVGNSREQKFEDGIHGKEIESSIIDKMDLSNESVGTEFELQNQVENVNLQQDEPGKQE